jgi:hypothetical protein
MYSRMPRRATLGKKCKELPTMKTFNTIVLTILIIGGLNWLLVGLFQFDLVASIFGGSDSMMSRVVYTIVGLCALYAIRFYYDVTKETTR